VRAYVGTPGFEEALASELAAAPRARNVVPGVVAADEPVAADVDPVFARQVLPDAVEVAGASVRALAEAAYAALEAAIDQWPGPFTVHAFPPPQPPAADADTALPAARLTHTRARESRRGAPPDRRKRASRRHVEIVAPADFDARVLLVQLLLVGRERLLVSAGAPHSLPRGGFDLSPWPAGAPPVEDDRAPPSRAYRKLEEAFQWMGAEPRRGETCVDLGAAPGSWTYAAARRGARVVALDRAPLAPAVARLPGVTTVAGDAFAYAPPSRVDWLVSDVVCEPARAISLIDRWLSAAHARNLVVTIKFKGRDQYGALSGLDPLLERVRPAFARIKQLAHNKNEVTVMIKTP
jgi:23S rRNA (cytidine2498-2'-O)-methyltransferase